MEIFSGYFRISVIIFCIPIISVLPTVFLYFYLVPVGISVFLLGIPVFPLGISVFLLGIPVFPLGISVFLLGIPVFPLGISVFLLGIPVFPLGISVFSTRCSCIFTKW